MDSEQERLQSLGFCGIFKESFKTIFTNRKIFGKISLAIIVPLTIVFLVVVPNSSLHLFSILRHHDDLKDTQKGTNEYSKINRSIKSEWATFAAFTIGLFTFYLFVSVLSICAVVYAVAYIYRSKEENSLKKIMGFLRKIWKRLVVTLLCYFAIVFVLSVVVELLFFLIFDKINLPVASLVLGIVLLILFVVSFVYVELLGQLACVVSVLEDLYGFKAMIKAKALIKGKKLAAVSIFLILSVLVSCAAAVFGIFVFSGWVGSLPLKIILGIIGFVLLVFVNLLSLVLLSVLYFVCKAHHRETVSVEE